MNLARSWCPETYTCFQAFLPPVFDCLQSFCVLRAIKNVFVYCKRLKIRGRKAWEQGYRNSRTAIWHWTSPGPFHYHIAFVGENFCEFRGFVAIRGSVLRENWGCGTFAQQKRAIHTCFSTKILFFTNSWKFSPSKVPAIRYSVFYCWQ